MGTVINHLLDGVWDYADPTSFKSWAKDTGDGFFVEIELPGFSKEDIEITADPELLVIQAKQGDKSKTHKIHLFDKVDLNRISTELNNGLLQIFMPKRHLNKPLKIKI